MESSHSCWFFCITCFLPCDFIPSFFFKANESLNSSSEIISAYHTFFKHCWLVEQSMNFSSLYVFIIIRISKPFPMFHYNSCGSFGIFILSSDSIIYSLLDLRGGTYGNFFEISFQITFMFEECLYCPFIKIPFLSCI